MASLNQLLAQARRKAFDQAGGDLQIDRRSGLHAEQAREGLPVYPNQPPGYYRLFCVHGKPMWQPCGAATCRRSKAEAARNYNRLLQGSL